MSDEHFEGHDGRECGEHRTTGRRAWCFICSEWCTPTGPCKGCELPALRERAEEAERQRDEALEALAYGAETLRRAEGAEAAVQRVRDLCARGPGPANEYQIWTVDVLAALDQPEGT